MDKKNAVGLAVDAVKLTPKQVETMRRHEDLSTARTNYISATQNAKAGGGSSLVARCARTLVKTGDTYGDLTDLAKAIRGIDPKAAIAWAEKYIAEKESTVNESIDKKTKAIKPAGVPTKADADALAAFKAYVDAGKYVVLADSLDVLVSKGALTYTESFKDKAGNACKRTVEVKDDVNAMFGFRVTAKVRLAGTANFAPAKKTK